MTNVRHIFLDLDGTLVGSSGAVRESLWEVLGELSPTIGLSVCTGRTRAGVAQEIAARLSPDGLHIFENGSLVAPATGTPVEVAELPPDDRARLVAASRRVDATLEFYTADGIFVSRMHEDCVEHARALDVEVVEADLERVAREHQVLRAHWIMREHAVSDVLAVPLEACEIGVASSPVLPQMIFASITRRGVSKGSAAAVVARELGFELHEAAGIGDAPGDLPLLEAVGHPYVVANASADLLSRFEVLGHVDEDGIELFLTQLSR